MKNQLICIFTFFVIFSTGCNKIKEDDVEPYKGKSYFPVLVGHEMVYHVHHIIFDSFSSSWDTSDYTIKEVIASNYTDNEGRETQRIERFIKNDTTNGNFIIYKVWASNILTSTGQRVEDNIRYNKLSFPQNLNVNWDGNALNNLGVQYYKYTALHEPMMLNGVTYDSTATVLQLLDTGTVVRKLFHQEIYAAKVGMIYKLNSNIYYNSGVGIVSSADIYEETLESYVE